VMVSVGHLKPNLGLASLQTVDPPLRGQPPAARLPPDIAGAGLRTVQRMGRNWSSPANIKARSYTFIILGYLRLGRPMWPLKNHPVDVQ
jgi:hypothetical protein